MGGEAGRSWPSRAKITYSIMEICGGRCRLANPLRDVVLSARLRVCNGLRRDEPRADGAGSPILPSAKQRLIWLARSYACLLDV